MPMGVRIDMARLRDAVKSYDDGGGGVKIAKAIGIHKLSLYRKLGQSQIGLEDLNEICFFIRRDAKDFLVYYEITERDIKEKREVREKLKKARKLGEKSKKSG